MGANPSVEGALTISAGARRGFNWIIVNASPPQLGRSWKRRGHMSRLGGADCQARSSTNNSEKSINQRMALRHRTQAECRGRKVDPWQEPHFHLPTTTTGTCCSTVFSKYLPILIIGFLVSMEERKSYFAQTTVSPTLFGRVCPRFDRATHIPTRQTKVIHVRGAPAGLRE
jgi:hypothetical protein